MNINDKKRRIKALKKYSGTLAIPYRRDALNNKITQWEAHVTAEANRIIENNDKNHAEAMGSMEHIKTMLMETELQILTHMENKMMPLPNQVDLLGILLQKTQSA